MDKRQALNMVANAALLAWNVRKGTAGLNQAEIAYYYLLDQHYIIYANNTIALRSDVKDNRPETEQKKEYFVFLCNSRKDPRATEVCEAIYKELGITGIKQMWLQDIRTSQQVRKMWLKLKLSPKRLFKKFS
jgi:hypothetical protein